MKSMRSHTKGPFRLAMILLLVTGGLTLGIAQTRYSANVVGYSDAEFVAGSNLVANPLNAGNNTLSNLFAGVPSGSFFLPWDPVSRTFGPANQFSSQSGWTDGAATLSAAQGGFLWLPALQRISFVGEPWPPMCITFPQGESVFGFMPRLSCDLCGGVYDCLINPPDGTVVQKWDRQNQQFNSWQFMDCETGWYPNPPTLAADEAALFQSPIQFRAKFPGFYSPSSMRLLKPSRDGANFVFQFPSAGAVTYSVQRSSNLIDGPWRTILTETASPAGGVITVTVPTGKNNAAFYRVDTLRLRNPSRAGSQFQFQFYAEEGVHYRVSRSPALSPGQWNLVMTIDGSGALVTAIDPAATATTAYYRLEY